MLSQPDDNCVNSDKTMPANYTAHDNSDNAANINKGNAIMITMTRGLLMSFG